MRWLKTILMVVFISQLLCPPAIAGTTVTFWYTPDISEGIVNFTITYINDQQLDLDWTAGDNITAVMIRASYGGYPDNITSENETPSSGYLVFSGNTTILHTSDTSMDFNMNPGPIYYRIWAQRADGTYIMTPQNASKESAEMFFLGLIGLSTSLLIVALIFKKGYLAFAGAASWLITSIYCFSLSETTWDIRFCLGFLFIAFMLVESFSPLAWRETTPPNEETEEPDITAMREEMEAWNKRRSQYNFLYQKPVRHRAHRITRF